MLRQISTAIGNRPRKTDVAPVKKFSQEENTVQRVSVDTLERLEVRKEKKVTLSISRTRAAKVWSQQVYSTVYDNIINNRAQDKPEEN